jgi:hypothetical protein
MRIVLLLLLAVLGISVSTCSKESPDEQRVKQILDELNSLASKPSREEKEQTMEALRRLQTIKKSFPVGRDRAAEDVRIGREFFTASIEGDERIIALWRELSSLNISKTNAACVRANIEMQTAEIENTELAIEHINLLLDENIKDKTTLNSRLEPLTKKSDAAKRHVDDLEIARKQACKEFGFSK